MAEVSNGNVRDFPGKPFEVAERRPKIAHGETVGINAQINKAPDGAKDISVGDFLPPHPGLEIFYGRQTHGFTVGYFLSRLRRWGRPVLKPTRTAGKGSSRSAARWAASGIRSHQF